MNKKILIVEDQFVEANDLQLKLRKAGYEVCGIARSVPIAQEMIKKEKPGLVLLDIFLKGKLTGIDLAKQIRQENIAFVYLSANSNEEVLNEAKATEPYGFLVKPFREKDLLIMLEIARYRHEHSVESNLNRSNILNDKLSTIIDSTENWEKKVLNICRTMQTSISFDYFTIGFNTIADTTSQPLSFLRIGYDEYQMIAVPELITISGLSMQELTKLVSTVRSQESIAISNEEVFEQLCLRPSLEKVFSDIFQVRSCISLPLRLSNGAVYLLCFYSKKPDAYTTDNIASLTHLQPVLAKGIESMSVSGTKNSDLSKTIDDIKGVGAPSLADGFEGIVGKSHLLLNVFDLITHVAPSDTSVLILGESGTGKERIADCIHNLSPRKNKSFVKVNCAALPSTLIESELFGHEKGSFTGALEKRIGKFEKADKGTIFLDEIGEMSPDLQVKLLRVLQEKYIERIGAKDITKIDVRIIAATNRNLEKEVADGRFRLDLYYRLNVFPIELPPLRERSEDISALAYHFISHYNQKAGKRIISITDKALNKMMAYSWPGNIRELENLIERSVLLAKGTTIDDVPLPDAQKKETFNNVGDFPPKTIHENERDHIIAILKKCNGRIWGKGGAADLLNVPPTTLTSKMKKLGIQKENIA